MVSRRRSLQLVFFDVQLHVVKLHLLWWYVASALRFASNLLKGLRLCWVVDHLVDTVIVLLDEAVIVDLVHAGGLPPKLLGVSLALLQLLLHLIPVLQFVLNLLLLSSCRQLLLLDLGLCASSVRRSFHQVPR